ncbi:helix-turn-helix domain-containing protein [Pseudogemmobacter sonorensis]|uniref:helix-turn-helix domain-containing protein n=1 Tax=Pseudogemmobacter sonorensis TaxID=2989681 RepID=UPI003F6815B9
MGMTPYTPETLADRWGVSASSVRNACRKGELRHFRFGNLYRIPAAVVEEIEQCQISASDASEVDIVSIGQARMADASGISFRHAPERKRSRKP